MNVLHLNSEKGWRGGEQQLAYLVEETQHRGVTNWVVCRRRSAMEAYCQTHQIDHISFKLTGGISIGEALRLKRVCRQHHIDLIHAHGSKTHTLAVLSAVFGNRIPIVISRRVAFPIRQNFFTRWKYNHSSVKKIICISETVKQVVARSIDHLERLTVVYSGINTRRFTHSSDYLRDTYPEVSDRLVIGTVAALSDSKDLYTFLNTAAILCESRADCHFFIVGEGPEREGLERYTVQKKLPQRVTMTGFVDNVDEILPGFDLYLTTPKVEGLGTSVLDAFACHVPVVATRAGGIPEMVLHEKTGLLADVGDAATLAHHLERVASDSTLRNQLIEAAYQHLLDHFTKEKMAQGTLETYRSLMAN